MVNDLGAPIQARVVRINPVEWYGHISLRMELYGCRLSSGDLVEFLTKLILYGRSRVKEK